MKSKHIKKFIFDRAQYFVGDGNGNEVLLKINYYKNTYKIVSVSKTVNQKFAKDLERIARDLLERKHGKNFAK